MKRSLLLVMLLAVVPLSLGADSFQQKDYPILPESLADIAGEAIWYYAWPHGLLPLEPRDCDLISGPFDYTIPTKGRTMENWGMKTTYRSKKKKGDTQFSVWVLEDESGEDRSKFQVGPIGTVKDEATSRTCEFHNLRAGISVLVDEDAPEQEFERHGRLQGQRNVILAFRN